LREAAANTRMVCPDAVVPEMQAVNMGAIIRNARRVSTSAPFAAFALR
jgi:hypothetical protein